MILFLVGQWSYDGPWEVQGVFEDHVKAVEVCEDETTFFILPLNLNEVLPIETMPTGNEEGVVYYPASEKPSERFKERWLASKRSDDER